MALLMRPTSPFLTRLCAGLVTSASAVCTAHWLLYPADPFCVLSLGLGAFVYVAVVGTSHSVAWYGLFAPTVMFGLLVFPRLPAWYAASLDPPPKADHRRRPFLSAEWHLAYADVREVLRPLLAAVQDREECQIVDLGCGTSSFGSCCDQWARNHPPPRRVEEAMAPSLEFPRADADLPSPRASCSFCAAGPEMLAARVDWSDWAELNSSYIRRPPALPVLIRSSCACGAAGEASDEEEADDPAPVRSKTLSAEAWEARPFSRDSTASTLSTGKYRDEFGAWRPQTCSSRPSLPSTASASSSARRPSRSTCSRSDSFRSSATQSSHKRQEASRSLDPDCSQSGANSRELALNDVKLEDARQRASKSLEALQAKLRASRTPEIPRQAEVLAAVAEDQPGQIQEPLESVVRIRPAWSEKQRGAYGERDEGTASTALRTAGAGYERMPAPQAPSRLAEASQAREVDRHARRALRPEPSTFGQRYFDPADGV
ncbi:unnamed protein product [Symbiodinium sp. CCMP2592]|nr:unnamed protein product [Symbiodinium sp. CCMP2592]